MKWFLRSWSEWRRNANLMAISVAFRFPFDLTAKHERSELIIVIWVSELRWIRDQRFFPKKSDQRVDVAWNYSENLSLVPLGLALNDAWMKTTKSIKLIIINFLGYFSSTVHRWQWHFQFLFSLRFRFQFDDWIDRKRILAEKSEIFCQSDNRHPRCHETVLDKQ